MKNGGLSFRNRKSQKKIQLSKLGCPPSGVQPYIYSSIMAINLRGSRKSFPDVMFEPGYLAWRLTHNQDGTIDLVPIYEKEIPIDEFTDFPDKDTASKNSSD